MSKIYVISTKYIGDDYFFNNGSRTGEIIMLPYGKTELHKIACDDVIVYGFDNAYADYPEDVERLLDSLTRQFAGNDANIVFILHDKNLCKQKMHFFHKENVIGFQHEDYDFFGRFLRIFRGTALQFAQRADYLIKALHLYNELSSKIGNCIYELDPKDPLISVLREFELTDYNCIFLRKELAKKMRQ